MKYPPSFQHYLKTQFYPAQKWALSREGKSWIIRHIPTLAEMLENRYDDCIFGIYLIRLNGSPLYVGESVRAVRRLCVHAWHLCTKPELFGLTNTDISSAHIAVEFLKEGLYAFDLRKAEESFYRDTLKPLLQQTRGSDVCIPCGKRKAAVRNAINIA